VLAEFAQSEQPPGPEQQQTIRSAEFELLYFVQQYVTNVSAGRPMRDYLLTYEQGWAIRGEYYPALQAISISLENAKESTAPQITAEGNIRHLLERISRWLNKRAAEQSAAPESPNH
jgi:hypothetical protein